MLQGFVINVKDLHLTTSGSNPTLPLRMSANAFKSDGMPYGLVVSNGLVHNAMPEGLPALIAYVDGGVEIREQFNVATIAEARFVVSGSALLVSSGKMVEVKSPLNLMNDKNIDRMGVGVLSDGRLFFFIHKCTVRQLQLALHTFGAVDAMMLAYGDVCLEYPRGGAKMGTSMPVTAFEAIDFKELPRPIVVIDPGHGGADPGTGGFGVKEKDLNLSVAKYIHKYFLETFEGTFVMMRIDDSTVDLEQRCEIANAIGADFFLSIHCNGFKDPQANGYETFVHPDSSKASVLLQTVLHKEVMNFLAPFGINDRGTKTSNLMVLRETDCPAVLVENLFLTNLKDNEFIRDEVKLKGVALATAKGFAKGADLKLKATTDVADVDKRLYKVQVGAFRFRKGAEDLLERLYQAGFDGFIKRE